MNADWGKMKREYIRTKISQRDLAKKYGVSYSTLKQIAKREQWKEKRTQFCRKSDANFIDQESARIASVQSDIAETCKILMGKIKNAVQNLDESMIGFKDTKLRDITGAMRDVQELLHVQSDADMREQEARINKMVHDIEQSSQDNGSITVRLMGDLDGYAD